MFRQRNRVEESIIARVSRLVFQLIGVIVFGLIFVCGLLVWRVTAGPVSLTFLTPYFEKALSAQGGSYRTVLQDTILKWVGGDRAFDLQLRGAQILGPEGALFAQIPELSVSLSAGALMQGRIAAKVLSITGPHILVIRNVDGTFGLELPHGRRSGELLDTKLLDELLQSSNPASPLAELIRVDILNASVILDDRRLGTMWQAPKANITLERGQTGIAGIAEIDLKLGANLAKVRLNASIDAPDGDIALTVRFSKMNPSYLSKISRQFSLLNYVDVPISGTFATKISLNGAIKSVAFDLKAGKGTVNVMSPLELALLVKSGRLRGSYDQSQSLLNIERLDLDLGAQGQLDLPNPINHKLPLRSISIAAKYLFDSQKLELEEVVADLVGSTLHSRGVFQEIAGQISFAISGDIRGMEIDAIGRYWPKSFGSVIRTWVTENLSVGRIPIARAKLSGRWSKGIGTRIDSLIGDMALRNLTVDYYSPMPKATAANGRAKFDNKMFEIEFDEADVGGLEFRDGRILFRGLGEADQVADIQLNIDGSLKSTLDLMTGKPLEFTKAINIKTYNLAGTGSTEVKLNFVVEQTLTPDQVKFSTNSIMRDVSISNIAFGKTMTHGNLVLNANNRGLEVGGNARLDNMPVKLKWRENFDADVIYQTQYALSGRLSAERWGELFNLDVRGFEANHLSGDLKFDVTVDVKSNGDGVINAAIDLKETRISLPKFGWAKSKKVEAKAQLSGNITASGINQIPFVEVIGGGMTLIGDVEFHDNKFSRFNFKRWEFGRTSISGSLLRESQGWRINLQGPRLDLISFLDHDEREDQKYLRGPRLKVNLNIDRVEIAPGKFLRNVFGELSNNGLVWSDANLSSFLDYEKSLVIKLSPKDGKRYLNVASNDAGAVLQAFGLYKDIMGGNLALKAEFEDMSPDSKVVGEGIIEDFRLIDAPILARLLGIASITGIPDELAGAGLSFQRFDVPFTKKNGIVEIKDAKAGGFNLGITASGTLDLESETLDIKGSIAPMDKVNSLLGNIPLFGVLFSGGEKGGGVFAAEYSMVGPIDNPEIVTNPLTALTPGIFRKIFEILPGANLGGTISDWPDPDDLN